MERMTLTVADAAFEVGPDGRCLSVDVVERAFAEALAGNGVPLLDADGQRLGRVVGIRRELRSVTALVELDDPCGYQHAMKDAPCLTTSGRKDTDGAKLRFTLPL